MAHTARGISYQSYDGHASAPAGGERPRSWGGGGGGGWLETLHRKHVESRAQLRGDVAQGNALKKELVTFFSLYRDADLGRADDLVREWRGGRELEDINRELKKRYEHNLFDLHEFDSAHPIRNNPLEGIILNERLKRVQADADKQREELVDTEARCGQLEEQNVQLRADLQMAVEEVCMPPRDGERSCLMHAGHACRCMMTCFLRFGRRRVARDETAGKEKQNSVVESSLEERIR